MDSVETAALVSTPYDAFNERHTDPEWRQRAIARLAPDVVWCSLPFAGRRYGATGYLRAVLGWDEAFPDAEIRVRNLVACRAGVVVELVVRGTHFSPLILPDVALPPTFRPIELHVCDVYTVEEGLIIGGRSYWDVASLVRQLKPLPRSQEQGA